MIRFDDFKLIPPHRFARLMASIGEPPYKIVRPEIVEDVEDVDGVRAWLRRHPDGGWLQTDDDARMVAARRLLFIAWLRGRGEITDTLPTANAEAAAARAAGWPTSKLEGLGY